MPPLLGLGNDYSFIETVHKKIWNGENDLQPSLKVSIVILYTIVKKFYPRLWLELFTKHTLELIEVIIADDGSIQSRGVDPYSGLF